VALKNHKIVLDGSTFMIRSDVDEGRIREIEQTLNDNLEKVRGGTGPKVPFTDALVLVLFKLADTLLDRQAVSRDRLDHATRELSAIHGQIEEIRQLVAERLEMMEEDDAG
jgi:hypothetical protein